MGPKDYPPTPNLSASPPQFCEQTLPRPSFETVSPFREFSELSTPQTVTVTVTVAVTVTVTVTVTVVVVVVVVVVDLELPSTPAAKSRRIFRLVGRKHNQQSLDQVDEEDGPFIIFSVVCCKK